MMLFCMLLFGAGAAGSTLSLNGAWQFTLAPDATAESRLARFHEPGFDASAFRAIRVPSNWAMEGFEEPMYGRLRSGGTGFYLHRFQAPRELAGRRVLLHFDAVWPSAEVWLNGRTLGRHDSGFTSFAFEVQDAIRPGEENTLAVQVRQLTRDYLFDANDDWSLGGIFRDVWLEWMPSSRYIDHVATWTTFDEGFRDADLHIRVLVNETRRGAASAAYQLRAVLAGAGDAVVTAESHRDTGREHLFRIHVRGPRRWTAETPHLYPLRVELVENGVAVQAREHRVGFRQVSTAGGVLRLNGQPIKLRGVCRHDQHPEVGNATRREHWLEDLRLMKDANVNAIRMVHYPPAAGFLDLCDEMGMYVLDEVPMGFGGDLGVDPSYAAAALLRTYETVARDRNHPSVIAWDVGNENPVTALHMAAVRNIKGTDPTRPVLLPWHAEEWLPPEVDILAPHYPAAAVARAIVARADRPVVATEYSHALAEGGFGDHAARWDALTSRPAGAGGTIWMWQDQGLWHGADKRLLQLLDGSDGIVSADRKPQRDLWEAKAVYAPVRVLMEKVAPDPGQRTVSIPIRNDFDFTNLENVTIRWTLMSGERGARRGETRLPAPPGATASLALPLDCGAGQPCYAHLAFLRPDGSEIARRSVEFTSPTPAAQPPAPARLSGRKRVTLKTRTAEYEFDPATGLLTAASHRGRRILTGLRPAIWRPLNANEKYIYQRRSVDAAKFPDLDDYTVHVKKWSATPGRIEAETEHLVNERNAFSVRWTYTSLADGSLDIAYTISPRVEAPWIPEAGVELAAPGLDRLRWLGLGPLDAFPNLKEAALFGIWRLDAPNAGGVKAEVRWAELTDVGGAGLHLEACRYLRLAAPGRLRVLSAVEGRPSAKFQRAERAEDRLDSTPGTTIAARFTLRLLP